jgi:hypothetical protein
MKNDSKRNDGRGMDTDKGSNRDEIYLFKLSRNVCFLGGGTVGVALTSVDSSSGMKRDRERKKREKETHINVCVCLSLRPS